MNKHARESLLPSSPPRQLAKLGVIAPVGGFIGDDFQQRYVWNACGNRIGVWRLGSAGLARALVRAHGRSVAVPVQTELFNHRGAASAERMMPV